MFLKYGRYVLIRPHHLDVADRWFERRGQITVFLTRMMPGVRTFISVPAGISRMHFGKFLVYSLLGAILWNAALAYLGFVFGANWETLQGYFERYNTVFYMVFAAAVLLAIVVWRVRRNRQGRRQSGSSGDSSE